MNSTNQVPSTNPPVVPTNNQPQLNILAQNVVANQAHVTKLQSQVDALEKQSNGIDLKFNVLLIICLICIVIACFAAARRQRPKT